MMSRQQSGGADAFVVPENNTRALDGILPARARDYTLGPYGCLCGEKCPTRRHRNPGSSDLTIRLQYKTASAMA